VKDQPHRRLNLLTGEWVLVSAHRTARPWLGAVEDVVLPQQLEHDPNCYLCPGSKRANQSTNPDYKGTFVFTNDFPALLPDADQDKGDEATFRWESVRGTSRVICYSPRHDLNLGALEYDELLQVIHTWQRESEALFEQYEYVQVFENRGEQMGASNPHPHGQIWAGDFIPTEIEKELKAQRNHFGKNGQNLLWEYLQDELGSNERIVFQNDSWAVLVPFWATWPFETMLLPKFSAAVLPQLGHNEVTDLAKVLKLLISTYDTLFETSFPYSMGWHQAPKSIRDESYWTLHGHFYPPLLRSASIRKFMVGYELLAEAQRDITPESAAETLRRALKH